ncbi:hypothetical protein [Pontibacter actiniarum]|uniref:hypothetical protein n=1 Tax=Pontibacter actiniarum TaxID=323450 RepID=UPI0003FCE6CF|nr:hypothetical protein [Pontibacter actiniarum]
MKDNSMKLQQRSKSHSRLEELGAVVLVVLEWSHAVARFYREVLRMTFKVM